MAWILLLSPALGLVFFLLTVTGSLLYFSDRKEFLQRRKGSGNVSFSLTMLGLTLIVESVLSGIFSRVYWGAPTLGELVLLLLFYCAFCLLPFVLGIFWLTDGLTILGILPCFQPSKQKIGSDEALKYPEGLFAKYVELYPHNPEGVLKWHIHKKMKEGKTREQAIKELQNHT